MCTSLPVNEPHWIFVVYVFTENTQLHEGNKKAHTSTTLLIHAVYLRMENIIMDMGDTHKICIFHLGTWNMACE